jgi:uncharacterized protein
MKRIGEIRLPFDHGPQALDAAVERLGIEPGCGWRVLKKSLDARRGRPSWVYSVGVPEPGDGASFEGLRRRPSDPRPVVVGAGPGGLFAAYWLALHGVPPVLLEQGEPMAERVLTMARFMRLGELDERSNLGFGAGGAGAYSDGKLMTRVKSPYIPFVMETFVRFGAPEEVRTLADPHVGSSRIRRVIHRFIEHLVELGVELRFRTAMVSLSLAGRALRGVVLEDGRELETAQLLLAGGHSARALYRELVGLGVATEVKPFAVGARLEHPVEQVDRIQLGHWAGHPALGAARYRLASTWATGNGQRAVYSFCMCPGGHVLNAATERDGVVSNGMSNYGHRGRFSNGAFVVNVEPRDLGGEDVLRGVSWQRALEVRAAEAANPSGGCHALPGQRLVDFLGGCPPSSLPEFSCPSPIRPAPLHELLPGFVVEAMRRGFEVFERQMRGVVSPDALLVGVETRTSAPVRLLRDDHTRQSPTVQGLYPIGEGAGYAGGITSAAVDGIASANALLETLPLA